ENWVNVGTYRVMIHDAKRLGFYISPGKHGRVHRDKFVARNEPMPGCIVVGAHPPASHPPPDKRGRVPRARCGARKEPMPVCIGVGAAPLNFLIACTEMPY